MNLQILTIILTTLTTLGLAATEKPTVELVGTVNCQGFGKTSEEVRQVVEDWEQELEDAERKEDEENQVDIGAMLLRGFLKPAIQCLELMTEQEGIREQKYGAYKLLNKQ